MAKTTTKKKTKAQEAEAAHVVDFVEVDNATTETHTEVEPITAEEAVSVLKTDFVSAEEVAPLTAQSLQYFPPDIQKNILALADAIDVTQTDKVMAYGEAAIIKVFEQSGKVLKSIEGTTVDQRVMQEVLEIAKQANEARDDFNFAIKEPSPLTKVFLKLFASAKDKRTKEIAAKAVTNYRLLEQLNSSYDRWQSMLQEAYANIHQSLMFDTTVADELEQYIVAGCIAEERISKDVDAAGETYELTTLATDKKKYEDLKDGLDVFRITLLNLQKARGANAISTGQLDIIEKGNKKVQIAIRTQKVHSMAVAAQQLRNAVFDAQNRIVKDGLKSLTFLNSELMKKVSTNAVLTAAEAEELLLSGVYTVDSALEAARTVIDGCKAIEEAREKRPEVISSQLGELNTLISELTPVVNNIKAKQDTNSSSSSNSSTVSGGLKF